MTEHFISDDGFIILILASIIRLAFIKLLSLLIDSLDLNI
jgi:hypothetical protein